MTLSAESPPPANGGDCHRGWLQSEVVTRFYSGIAGAEMARTRIRAGASNTDESAYAAAAPPYACRAYRRRRPAGELADEPEDTMDCPNCGTTHSQAARFCARCGLPLHRGTDRAQHFAAQPAEPVSAPHVLSTLMPHLVGSRLHVYRDAIALALISALIASAFGTLSVALVLAAAVLPAAVLAYVHDHGLWRGNARSMVALALLVSLALGVAVGLLQRLFALFTVLYSPTPRLPAVSTVLELGVLLPVVVFVATLITPVIVTTRPGFRHPVDAVVMCTLSGAALSLGLSIVVQLGAFTAVTYGEPTQVAFIALTLGFVQPIIFGTATACALMPLRGAHTNTAVGLLKGLALVVVYELGTTLLTPCGTRGIVLTAALAVLVAAAGLTMTRADLHAALLAEAGHALETGATPPRAAVADRNCPQCHAAIAAGAVFCQACGAATAALGHQVPANAATPT